MIRYAKPGTLDQALALLGEARWRILAGGTDFYPAQGSRPLADNVLDINGLEELRGISETPVHIFIGARTSWTELIRNPMPDAFDALKQAAREVGSVQIQNMATVAGNLCNASPAADGVPALMILDAEVELRSAAGARHLPLDQFILGNRRTALRPDEMVTSVRVPKASAEGNSSFQKLGGRRYLVISIAMAAARISLGAGGAIDAAAVSLGACSAVAKRLADLEARLIGIRPGRAVAEAVAAAEFEGISPIDDVRGTAGYRNEAAREIVLRAIEAALSPAKAVAA